MPDSVRMWIEVSFNVTYLVVVWGLVIAMARRQPIVSLEGVIAHRDRRPHVGGRW